MSEKVTLTHEQRIMAMQKIAEKTRSTMPDVQEAALAEAIATGDEESAAEIARSIRNRMLEESDKEMVLDRMGLSMPSENTFTSWLSFLKGLAEIVCNDWGKYRQALRDLPAQEGFPFKIVWPKSPKNKQEAEERGV